MYPTRVPVRAAAHGLEVRAQILEAEGRLPDVLVACVGGGSNAIGLFHPFLEDDGVRMLGVEPGGEGLHSGRHGATLTAGVPGIFHGKRTYVLSDDDGQIFPAHSISAGLDYPGVGPEHAFLKDIGRAEYVVADRRRSAGRLPCTCRARKASSPPSRVGPRGRPRPQARADAPAGRDPGREPLGPRRQGRAPGSRDPGRARAAEGH